MINPTLHSNQKAVFFRGADFAHWKEKGLLKIFICTFCKKVDAMDFISVYKSLAELLTTAEEALAGLDSLHDAVKEIEEDEEGECPECWNKGCIGDACDNCGTIMVVKTPDHSIGDSFDDRSLFENPHSPASSADGQDERILFVDDEDGDGEEYLFANTQEDWPVEPLKPFGNR